MSYMLTRSALYIPGSKPRALAKALTLPTDMIIFDLEDAVAPDAKSAARRTLTEALHAHDFAPRNRIVRMNGLSTPEGRADAHAIRDMPCDGVALPKVEGVADLDAVTVLIPGKPIWAMIETPMGVLNAPAIAAHAGVAGIIMGTNDLAKELRARTRAALQHALQTCLLSARAHGKIALDGVFNAFQDDEGLQAECRDGRDLGFDGKTLIHPAQLAICNATFGPTPDEIALAKRHIAAFEAVCAAGQGVAVVDGKIVESLHVATARATLAAADAITAREGT